MLGGRAVDGLEQADAPGMEVARGGDTEAALDHGRQVGEDVAEHVAGDDRVEPLGVLDAPHGRGVDVGMLARDVRVLPPHLLERAGPEVHRAHGVRLVHQRQLLRLVAPAREIEGVADHALGTLACEQDLLGRDLVGGALLEVAVHAGVGVLGVLANDDEVDVLGLLVLERAQMLGIELDRAQVHVEVETEAQARDDAELELADRNAGIADRAQ